MQQPGHLQQEFFTALGGGSWCEALFDQVPDTVFFQKDHLCRYMSVNQTLVERCGLKTKNDLIGHSAVEVFPTPLGAQIAAQDQGVLQAGKSIRAKLELHLYARGLRGWCLTWKEPLRNGKGDVIGLAGLSRDLRPPASLQTDLPDIANAMQHIEDNISAPLKLADLAKLAGLTDYQLAKRVRGLFGITLGQYITRARIDHACDRLRRDNEAISAIALACGYSDQAAFSRQFRQSVGLSPAAYRKSAA